MHTRITHIRYNIIIIVSTADTLHVHVGTCCLVPGSLDSSCMQLIPLTQQLIPLTQPLTQQECPAVYEAFSQTLPTSNMLKGQRTLLREAQEQGLVADYIYSLVPRPRAPPPHGLDTRLLITSYPIPGLIVSICMHVK